MSTFSPSPLDIKNFQDSLKLSTRNAEYAYKTAANIDDLAAKDAVKALSKALAHANLTTLNASNLLGGPQVDVYELSKKLNF
ncbi:MAG TPA: hypothetical protein V6C52_05740 [Coleofasciculaceae cyanobacterium]|jgi:hypothetical protein